MRARRRAVGVGQTRVTRSQAEPPQPAGMEVPMLDVSRSMAVPCAATSPRSPGATWEAPCVSAGPLACSMEELFEVSHAAMSIESEEG